MTELPNLRGSMMHDLHRAVLLREHRVTGFAPTAAILVNSRSLQSLIHCNGLEAANDRSRCSK